MPLIFALSLGCSGPSMGEQAPSSSASDTLVVAMEEAPRAALDAFAWTEADSALVALLQVPLLDSSFACGLQHGVGAAQGWTFREGNVLDLTLRSDLAWEDGTPLSGEDFRLGFQVAADPRSARALDLHGVSLELPDPRTLRFHLPPIGDRGRQLARVAALEALPHHRLGDGQDPALLREHPLNTRSPLSYGPWKLESWTPTELVLVPNSHAPFDQQPRLSRVVLRVLPESNQRMVALERGEVDLVPGLTTQELDRIGAQDLPVVLRHRGMRTLDFVPWNLGEKGEPALRDPRVRTALAMATDLDTLQEQLLTTRARERFSRPAVGTLTPGLCRSHPDAMQRLPLDTTAASVKLAEAGWSDANGDGLVDQGGEALRLTMITLRGNGRHASMALQLVRDFRQIGVSLEVESLDAEAWRSRLASRDFDGALMAWNAGLTPDLSSAWASDGAYNLTGYAVPEVDALLKQEQQTTDPNAALALRQQIQQKIYADQPALFLVWIDEVAAMHTRVQEADIDLISPLNHLYRWWVPTEKQLRTADGLLLHKDLRPG